MIDIKEWFNYGLPTVLLVAAMVALWRAAVWAKRAIVEPVVAAHLKTVDTFNTEMPKQTVLLSEIKDSIDVQTEVLHVTKKSVEDGLARSELHSKWCSEVVKGICKLQDNKGTA